MSLCWFGKVEKMKILAIEHELPNTVAEDFQRYANEEARRTWDLHQSGLIRELYFRSDQDEAVLVLECASVEEAQQTVGDLPFVREGFITFELIPLKAYPGFERLFAKD
jgi:muconolactone delta-isomerase